MYTTNTQTSAYGHPNPIPTPAIPTTFPTRFQHHPPGEWTTGLFHCFDDPAICLITCCCPCITFGQISEIVNRGHTSCFSRGLLYAMLLGFTGCACLYSFFYRSRLRGQYDLEEEPCNDCLVHFCCGPFALCQEYRELKNRGFDMEIGRLGSQHGEAKAWSCKGANSDPWNGKKLIAAASSASVLCALVNLSVFVVYFASCLVCV